MSDEKLSQNNQEEPIGSAPDAAGTEPEMTGPAPDSVPDIKMSSADDSVVRPVQFSPLGVSAEGGFRSGMDLIMDVHLHVAVELGRTVMQVRDVLALGPGSIVELEKQAGEPVEVVVNNKVVARGEVVVIDENFGVRVTEIVNGRSREADARAA